MENKVLFLDPLDIRPHFKRGTEGLIGASILGGTGLMSGILGSSSAHANNKAMIQYNQWAQKDAQAYNTQMYERQLADQEAMYNKYQSPQAIAQQLKDAGINPSALAAGQGFSGGSMPSIPTAGSSPVTQLSGLQNTGTPIGQGLQAAAGAIADLSHANEADANAKATSEKLSHEVNLLLARQRAEQAVAINTELQNSLTQKYGDKKWSAEIGHLASMAYANWAQGDLNAADVNYKDVLRQLANFQLDMDNETRSYLIGKVVESYNLLKAEQQTEKSKQVSNYAVASNQREQAKTERDLRTERESALRLLNRVRSVDADKAEATKEDAIVAALRGYMAMSATSDADRAQAQLLLDRIEDTKKLRDNNALFKALDSSSEWVKSKLSIFGK